MKDEKSLYRELSSGCTELPLFLRGWWLDALCGEDGWSVVVVHKSSTIEGVLVNPRRRKGGVEIAYRAPLTPYSGVWIPQGTHTRRERRSSHERRVMTQLIDRFEEAGYGKVELHLHPGIVDYLPFYWRGYTGQVRYTYIIRTGGSLEELWGELALDHRRRIKRTEARLHIEESEDLDLLYTLAQYTFKRQGMDIPYSFELLSRLDAAAKTHSSRKILVARDTDGGKPQGALYLVWDDTTAYYLIGGSDPESGNSGSSILLLWRAIGWAKERGLAFNFEGSMIEPIERFFRAFGGELTPYLRISKVSSTRARLYLLLRSLAKGD